MDPQITALIAIAVGIVLCLFGFKIQKFVITLAWFALGFTIAERIGSNFITSANTLLLIEVISGIVLASLGYKLEKLALCIAVAYMSFETVGTYITGFDQMMTFAIQLGISLLLGILSMLFIKPILIVITSIAGASLIKSYLPVFITLEANILLIIAIVFAVAGFIIQLKSN